MQNLQESKRKEQGKGNIKGEEFALSAESKFVTFLIGEETYGVDVLRVEEIIGMTEITHVPNTTSFMKGVINLRGSVVPVVDMRMKFEMEGRDYDTFTVILIVEVKGRSIGMIVDSVSDVVSIPVASIQDTPNFTSSIETNFIMGIGQLNDKLIIMLDVESVLTQDELKRIDSEKIDGLDEKQ